MRERAVSSATKKNCRIAPSPDGTSLEAQCEQFDSSNPKDQDGKCHRIVFQPNTHHVPRFCDPSRPGLRVVGLGRNAVFIAMSEIEQGSKRSKRNSMAGDRGPSGSQVGDR